MSLKRREIAEIYAVRYVGFRNALAMLTGDYDSAADVVQEAFAEALRQRRKFRGEGSPEAWLWRIATRIAQREVARGRHEMAGRDGQPPDRQTFFVETVHDPAVAEALRTLPERRRLIIFLRYFGDLSYEQIAEICEITPGTVAATLAQARDALRAALEATDEVNA
jgi:RNA polymerase sigma-70 factor (ECF subfamily)